MGDLIMVHTILLICYLILGGIAAGILSSGASIASLASYPVLLSVGLNPVSANVTNDAALIWNSLGAVISSGRELRGHWKHVGYFGIFTVIGAATGCLLLLAFPTAVFAKLVPFFILTSGIMVLFSGRTIPGGQEQRPFWQQTLYCGLLIAVGIYAGYFGAASGVLVLVLLTYLTADHFLTVNAIKNAVCGMTNLTALIIYSFTTHIYWHFAIPLAIGMFIGGYVGPIIIRKIPVTLIRITIAFLAAIQAGIYFYQAYF